MYIFHEIFIERLMKKESVMNQNKSTCLEIILLHCASTADVRIF